MSNNNEEKSSKQAQLLSRLTATPLLFATVVKVNKPNTEKARPEDFQEGVAVRVSRESIFYKSDEEGTIITRPTRKNLPNWVRVRFANNGKENYRIGVTDPSDSESRNGECDLELVNKSRGGVIIACEGGLKEVELPVSFEVKPGNVVKISSKSFQIVELAQNVACGDICTVRKNVNEEMVEVDKAGVVRVVFATGLDKKPEAGDRVILDSTGFVIVANFGNSDNQFGLKAATNVSWDDIGGLDNAKKALQDAIERPYLHAGLYGQYGKKPVKGILMYSPPGCGKTLLCKALATSVAHAHKAESVATGYQYIKGPEILDQYLGGAEAKIRSIFERSRKHFKAHGYPAIVVIDEADAILRQRGTGISSDIGNTIVPMFLAEMDGLEESGAIVILLTNIPDCLDSAIVRDMRIDIKLKIERPDLVGAEKTFLIYFKKVPLNQDENGFKNAIDASAFAAQELFSKNRVLYNISLREGKPPMDFILGNLASGAMVTGIASKAKERAIDRDVASGTQKASGVTREDIVRAVEETFVGVRDINHDEALKEFTYDFRDDIVEVRKTLRQVAPAS